MLALTADQARALHLAAQGLLDAPTRRATKRHVGDAIARMAVLQIDTIHVVARSPYLVLFSRLGPFQATWLDDLLEEGRIFECWAHEACFAPIDDFPALRRHSLDRPRHWSTRHANDIFAKDRAPMEELLARIREKGPVKASELGGDKPGKGGFWQWKPEKRWLEAWFALGELMIARREKFQRVYDVRDRVLARARGGWSDGSLPSSEAARRALTVAAVRALGVTEARFVDDYFRTSAKTDDRALDELVADGTLERVSVRGWEGPGYVHRDHLPLARRAARGRLRPTYSTLLSPFDPIVWDRQRAEAHFDFEYRLECYVPEPKRRWGYFVLPILRRGELVGRLDAKAHREEGLFEVKALYLEPRFEPTDELAVDVAAAISACASWHATPRVVIRRCQPRGLGPILRRALAAVASR